MAKPIINYIYPFDATQDKRITFTYTGDLPYKNRLIIYDAETLSVIYDVTSASRVLYCTLPAGICTNGVKFAAAIQCFDANNVASGISDKTYFWCMDQASFYFSNVESGDVVSTSSLYAELLYYQPQDEGLMQFQFFIYDSKQVLLAESQVYYSTDYLTYKYSGLENEKIYYIRAKGLTQYGTELDTDFIEIDVHIDYDDTGFTLIDVDCNENSSIVTYYTNFVIVNSIEDGSLYEYEDSYINLTNTSLHYASGISVSGDFLLCIKIKEFFDTATLLEAADDFYGFTLSSYVYDNDELRFKLTVPNGLTPYILYSEPFIPGPTDIFIIYIKRVNDVYQLYVYMTENPQVETNMFFGIEEPEEELPERYDKWLTTENEPTVEVLEGDVHKYIMVDEPVVLAQDMYDIWIGGDDE